jgi:hypothetical protein
VHCPSYTQPIYLTAFSTPLYKLPRFFTPPNSQDLIVMSTSSLSSSPTIANHHPQSSQNGEHDNPETLADRMLRTARQAGFHGWGGLTTSSPGTQSRQTSATANSFHDQVHNAGEVLFPEGVQHSGKDTAKRFVIGLDYGTTFTSVVSPQFGGALLPLQISCGRFTP